MAMKEIIADILYCDPRPGTSKRQSLRKSIESGKVNPKEQPLFDEERINLNETAIEKIYVGLLQWLAEKLDFLSNYFINRVSLNQDYIPSK